MNEWKNNEEKLQKKKKSYKLSMDAGGSIYVTEPFSKWLFWKTTKKKCITFFALYWCGLKVQVCMQKTTYPTAFTHFYNSKRHMDTRINISIITYPIYY